MKNKIIVILGIIILFLIVFLIFAKTPILKKIYPKKYEKEVTQNSAKYEVEENLIYSIIKVESNFKEEATSSRNALRTNATNGRHGKRRSQQKWNNI